MTGHCYIAICLLMAVKQTKGTTERELIPDVTQIGNGSYLHIHTKAKKLMNLESLFSVKFLVALMRHHVVICKINNLI